METNKRMLQRDREEKKTSMAIAEYIARAEFNPRRNNHYVNNRTGNENQSLEASQRTY